jgi:hypothetical protein
MASLWVQVETRQRKRAAVKLSRRHLEPLVAWALLIHLCNSEEGREASRSNRARLSETSVYLRLPLMETLWHQTTFK